MTEEGRGMNTLLPCPLGGMTLRSVFCTRELWLPPMVTCWMTNSIGYLPFPSSFAPCHSGITS